MGKSITPKYRLETQEWINGRLRIGEPLIWRKQYGKPSADSIYKWIKGFNDSLELGGANEHLRVLADYKFMGGRIINQFTKEIVAEFNWIE